MKKEDSMQRLELKKATVTNFKAGNPQMPCSRKPGCK